MFSVCTWIAANLIFEMFQNTSESNDLTLDLRQKTTTTTNNNNKRSLSTPVHQHSCQNWRRRKKRFDKGFSWLENWFYGRSGRLLKTNLRVHLCHMWWEWKYNSCNRSTGGWDIHRKVSVTQKQWNIRYWIKLN